MKRINFLFFIIILISLLINCINTGNSNGLGPGGLIYTNYKIGLSGNNQAQLGAKKGKACVNKFFVWTTLGEADTREIALNAGIKDIKSIDREVFGFLNLFTNYCTVVTGD
jgi:hypothetical protein